MWRYIFFLSLLAIRAFGQGDIRGQIQKIADDAQGKVAVACSLPGSELNCDLNADAHPPMHSVFKFPLALTTLHLVETGTLNLDQQVRFLASDRIPPPVYSPLQDKYPLADIEISICELPVNYFGCQYLSATTRQLMFCCELSAVRALWITM